MIIGLLGMSKVGKDEVAANFIADNFVKFAFGDGPKREYATVNDLPLEEMYNEFKDSHRPGIIDLAESKRKINPYHWIDAIKGDIKEAIDAGKDIIISDIRRIPELIYFSVLKQTFGDAHLIEVVRPPSNGGIFDEDPETSRAIVYANFYDHVDYRLNNYSDLYYLDAQVEELKKILKYVNI